MLSGEGNTWFHIVDDEPELRELMRAVVAMEGYKPASFKSAEAYMDFFNAPQYIKPVAIIMDNRMSGMNGVELARCLRKRAPMQRMVITTATPADVETVESELCYALPRTFGYEQLKTMLRGLAACAKAYEADSTCFRHEICDFGLEHLCPFAMKDEVVEVL